MPDPLEGFRDLTPEQLEATLRERLGEHDFLVDLWQMGVQMREWVETPAGAYLFTTFRDRFNAAIRALMDTSLPEGEGARASLLEARRCWLVLHEINSAITVGLSAERHIIADDQRVTP